MSQMRDPGLQAERTALAWTRTSAVLLVNALLILRTGVVDHSLPLMAMAAVLLLGSATIFQFSKIRQRELIAGIHPLVAPSLVMTSVTAITVVACLSGLASLLVSSVS